MFKVSEFRWKAVNRFQQVQIGKVLAKNNEEVEQYLLHKGYSPIYIRRNFILPKPPKQEEITQYVMQLGLLINAAIPLKQSLIMILESVENIKLYEWLRAIIHLIESGFSFSAALEKQAKYLENQEVQLIKIAEQSGRLGEILTNIAQARSKSEKLKKKVKNILFYPLMILGVSFSLSLGMLLFIVPQFAELYQTKENALPLVTELLFWLSDILRHSTMALLFSFSIFFAGIILLNKKTTVIKKLKSYLLAHLPVFSEIVKQSRIVFFTQNVALMLNSHIRLDKVLASFLSEKNDDWILQQEIQTMQRLLQQGYRFSEGLNPMIFTSQAVQMISIGEKSGKLATMCEQVSDIYQQKLDYKIDMLSQLLEPLLMLIMGLIVGTIMVGLYLPIFDMGNLVE